VGIAILSSPYYEIINQRIQYGDKRSLQTNCVEFNIFNHLVDENNNIFVIDYVDKGHLHSFILERDFLRHSEFIYTPLEGYSDFLLSERIGMDTGSLILLFSESNGISIAINSYQFHHEFFQNFITNYEKCIKHNFNGNLDN
jgi:hypothetical protein